MLHRHLTACMRHAAAYALAAHWLACRGKSITVCAPVHLWVGLSECTPAVSAATVHIDQSIQILREVKERSHGEDTGGAMYWNGWGMNEK